MKLEILSRHPVEPQHATPIFFIHGMMHGAWCWDAHFLDYFAQQGLRTVAERILAWFKERKL